LTVLLVALALLGNAGCFASCLLPQAEAPSGSCHHHSPVEKQCPHQHVISSASLETARAQALPQPAEIVESTLSAGMIGIQTVRAEITIDSPYASPPIRTILRI
jgi:hypothetical protein